MENNFGRLWTLEEAAEVMGLTQSTVVSLTEGHPHGALPFISHMGALYFDSSDVARWFEVTAENIRSVQAA